MPSSLPPLSSPLPPSPPPRPASSASGEDTSVESSESVEWRGLSVESSSERVESVSDAIVVSSPTAQLHTPRVQMMLVQLLQRAAHTPEELLLFVSELGTAGLLSPDVVTGLCRDAGVGVGMLNAIRSGASGVDMNAAAATAASSACAFSLASLTDLGSPNRLLSSDVPTSASTSPPTLLNAAPGLACSHTTRSAAAALMAAFAAASSAAAAAVSSVVSAGCSGSAVLGTGAAGLGVEPRLLKG
mmetsp:Transcript_39980/g.95688  ORF Transcript_39980/g.95688 Transcript_39980/m.95688 type:complete len:244 (-) Transcript_39980:36-767(-)